MRAAVALGSNLGDRLFHLRAGRKAILQLPGVTPPILSSSIYETDPIGCEEAANAFLNAVVEFSYAGVVFQLLEKLKQIEGSLGRPRLHARNASRPIDADILYFGQTILKSDTLTLPHPRMHQRRFVLEPLAEIRPDLVLAGQTKTVRELLASIDQSGKVMRVTAKWEPG